MLNDAVALAAFEEALNDVRPGWAVHDGAIVGPGGASVRLVQSHASASDGHTDVQLVFEDAAHRRVELWDCVVGMGATHQERAQFAAILWSRTTAGAWLELMYSMRSPPWRERCMAHYRGATCQAG